MGNWMSWETHPRKLLVFQPGIWLITSTKGKIRRWCPLILYISMEFPLKPDETWEGFKNRNRGVAGHRMVGCCPRKIWDFTRKMVVGHVDLTKQYLCQTNLDWKTVLLHLLQGGTQFGHIFQPFPCSVPRNTSHFLHKWWWSSSPRNLDFVLFFF